MQIPVTVLVGPLNHVLTRSSWARERLVAHAGSIVELNLDLICLRLEIDDQGLLRAGGESHQTPDVSIAIPLSAVPRLALDDQKLAMGAVRLEGNAEIADNVAFVLRNLEWDAEADLAELVGDIAAHRIATGIRHLAPVPRRTAQSVAENLRDYLVEEQPVLVARAAITPGDVDVRTLRDDIARLEKRIVRLTSRQPTAVAPRSRASA